MSNAFTTKFETSEDDDYPEYISRVDAILSHTDHGEIANLHAFIVNRQRIKSDQEDFLLILDADSQETADFGSTVFGNQGHVKRHLVESGFRRGTGVWGEEVDHGRPIYIKTLTVDTRFRSQGLGSKLLQEFLQGPCVKLNDLVYCLPASIHATKEEFKELESKITKFYRKNNFRRMGHTQFFAYSPDPDHPSRLINPDSDAKSIQELFSVDATDLPPEQYTTVYPLHAAIRDMAEGSIAETIQSAYDADPSFIHLRDNLGFTPLFLSAITSNLDAIRKLLAFDMQGDLNDRRNTLGLTPLEAMQERAESVLDFSLAFLQKPPGPSNEFLTAEFLLKQALDDDQVRSQSCEEYIKARMYGCTCGRCEEGWLSARMKYRLLVAAEVSGDIISLGVEDGSFTRGKPLGYAECVLYQAEYIPPHLFPIYKTFYAGYGSIYQAIGKAFRLGITRYSPRLAIDLAVQSSDEYSRIVFYLQKGGRIEYVLSGIIHTAEYSCQDGSFEEAHETEEWNGLAHCANDEKFTLVQEKMGLDTSERWGPYDRFGDSEDVLNF